MSRDLVKQPVRREEAIACLLALARDFLARPEAADLDAYVLSCAANLCTVADPDTYHAAFGGK